MVTDSLKKALRFYFITDDGSDLCNCTDQVKIAIQAGATMIQYRNKSFSLRFFKEVVAVRDLCKSNNIPFIVNDNILLAKAVMADGVHLGQDDEDPSVARNILGPAAIVGISVSNLDELKKTDLTQCDYIGTGPVFATNTKIDAKKVCGLSGLEAVAKKSLLPVVAIGGINSANAESCFMHSAAGVAVISFVTRAENSKQNAIQLGAACGCRPRPFLETPWNDEFNLIEKLLEYAPCNQVNGSHIKVPPGDDACLLGSIQYPVITTDTQKEGVHFRSDWLTPEETGARAVEITLSDLAASYAAPISLFINLALPSHISDQTVEKLYKGIKKSLIKHNCTLGGGNISRSTRLSLDIFALGCGKEDIFPVRSGALAGEGLYCTGPLGLARAGLALLIKKDFEFKELIAKFISPSARFDAAKILAKNRVKCVTDISDGLAGDAKHIAEASKIAVEFKLKSFCFEPALTLFCKKYNLVPEEMVLAGGEDYELLFTCMPDKFEDIKRELPAAFKVGRCIRFNGKHLVNLPSGISSFQHGKKHII